MKSRLLFRGDDREVCRVYVLGRWAPVDLTGTGALVLHDGRWVCSPKHFGRLYRAGFARMVIDKGLVIDADAVEPGDLPRLGPGPEAVGSRWRTAPSPEVLS